MDAKRRGIILRILSFVLWVFLLVDGVSSDEAGEEKMSVTEGQSATLPGFTEIQSSDTILWKCNGSILFRVSEANNINIKTKDKRIKDRLTLDKKTGSLTITKITSEDAGKYELEIKKTKENLSKRFSVTVHDVSVSVMVGDSVTLIINDTETEKAEELLWTIEGGVKIIATFDRKNNTPPIYDDERFRDRLQLDKKMGSLTIMNIRNTDSGLYQLQIKTHGIIITKRFNVTVQGQMNTVSVKEGEPINLLTGLFEIQGHDLILWKFKDTLIAEINKGTNRFLLHDSSDEIFNGRLQLHPQTGSLIISGSRSTDSGVYHLQMISSSHTVQRTITVTVSVPDLPDQKTPDSGLSSGAVAGIVVGVLLLVFVAGGGIYYRKKISEPKSSKAMKPKSCLG